MIGSIEGINDEEFIVIGDIEKRSVTDQDLWVSDLAKIALAEGIKPGQGITYNEIEEKYEIVGKAPGVVKRFFKLSANLSMGLVENEKAEGAANGLTRRFHNFFSWLNPVEEQFLAEVEFSVEELINQTKVFSTNPEEIGLSQEVIDDFSSVDHLLNQFISALKSSKEGMQRLCRRNPNELVRESAEKIHSSQLDELINLKVAITKIFIEIPEESSTQNKESVLLTPQETTEAPQKTEPDPINELSQPLTTETTSPKSSPHKLKDGPSSKSEPKNEAAPSKDHEGSQKTIVQPSSSIKIKSNGKVLFIQENMNGFGDKSDSEKNIKEKSTRIYQCISNIARSEKGREYRAQLLGKLTNQARKITEKYNSDSSEHQQASAFLREGTLRVKSFDAQAFITCRVRLKS